MYACVQCFIIVRDSSAGVQVYAGLDYYAEPADIWSCGIVLVALLAGGRCVCVLWST